MRRKYKEKIKNDSKWGLWAGTDYILTCLPKYCRKINIPVAYFTGYFLGYSTTLARKDLMPYRDRLIDEMIEYNNIDILETGCLLSREMILENAEKSLLELKNREQEIDIRISDFIEERWRKEQLFYTVNHLSRPLYKEICRLILELLGIQEINYIEDIVESNGIMQLIWPCVESVLDFKQKYLFFNKIYDSNMYSKQEWIGKYIELYR